MADIGLLVSVAGLAQLAFEISKGVFNLIRTFKDSPQALSDLGQDVLTLGEVLERIRRKGETASRSTDFYQGLGQGTFVRVIKGCKIDLGRLEIIIVKLNSKDDPNSVWIRIRTTLKWKLLERHIESVKNALEAHKSLLTILLSLSIE